MILISSQIFCYSFSISEAKNKSINWIRQTCWISTYNFHGMGKTKYVFKSIFFILSFLNFVHKLADSTECWFSLQPGDSDPVDTMWIPKFHIVSKHCECLSYMDLLIFCLEKLSYMLSSFSNSLLNNKKVHKTCLLWFTVDDSSLTIWCNSAGMGGAGRSC